MKHFDVAIVGAGCGGLFAAAQLACRGKRVYVAEKHSVPGGYGQSFERIRHNRRYVFCAQLHYLFGCTKIDADHQFFAETGLDKHISFVPFNDQCFDHIVYPNISYKCRTGLENNIGPLAQMFPTERQKIVKYFTLVQSINDELLSLPVGFSFWEIAKDAWNCRHLIWYRSKTVQDVLDEFGFSTELQQILAGQSGNLMVPAEKASFVLFAGMVAGYFKSACAPSVPYHVLFDTLVEYINSHDGCEVVFSNEVTKIDHDGRRVTGFTSAKDGRIEAQETIVNFDPSYLKWMMPDYKLPPSFTKKLDYTYSASAFSVYLGLKNIDLRDHGFGNWNTWHYEAQSPSESYQRMFVENDYSSPCLFVSTPNLHHDYGSQISPTGHQQLVLVTIANYDYFKKIKEKGRRAYLDEKKKVTGQFIDVIQKRYIPNLRDHIDVCVSSSPLTNERYVNVRYGNVYGTELSPRNWHVGKIGPTTQIPNLHLTGAIAGFPGFFGGLHVARQLGNQLAPLNPASDYHTQRTYNSSKRSSEVSVGV